MYMYMKNSHNTQQELVVKTSEVLFFRCFRSLAICERFVKVDLSFKENGAQNHGKFVHGVKS